MSEFDQRPFSFGEFVENPQPRCPCVLILDNSGSMRGNPLAELNSGLIDFKSDIANDSLASQRVEVSLVTFGPVEIVSDFVTIDAFFPPTLTPRGDTPMGGAIEAGLGLLAKRKETYREAGVAYYRPWAFLITDGSPTDNWRRAAELVRQGEEEKAFMFFAVGVQGADMDTLRDISIRDPLMLREFRFRELFQWLSNSLRAVSQSQINEPPPLVNPVAPTGWAIAE